MTNQKKTNVLKVNPSKKRQKKIERIVSLVNQYQQLDNELFPKNTYVSLGNNKRKKPIILMFTADWHLGSRHCDHKAWLEDMKYLLSFSPYDVKLVLVGDLIDNVFPTFKSAIAVFGYLRPELQKELLRDVLDELRPYLEVACWGNHDVEWDEKRIGYSDVAAMLGQHCTYFHGNGVFDYAVGEQTYKINISHKMKGHSWFHALHGNIRGWLQTHADAVITAHGHEWGYLTDGRGVDEKGMPKDRHLLQIGSYKTINDPYADRYFKPGTVHNDCLVLSANEHEIMRFSNLYKAAKYAGITPCRKNIKI